MRKSRFGVRPFVIKLMLMPVLLVIACIFAGLYGAIHNQISYSVSPEYFTRFKFYQFEFYDTYPDRVGAALVGWGAAWWMGSLIGYVLVPLGLVIPGPRKYFKSMIKVLGVVAVTTLIVGLGALVFAIFTLSPESVGELTRYGNKIEDDLAFARTGSMHNFSYLGGLVGIITGAVAVFKFRR